MPGWRTDIPNDAAGRHSRGRHPEDVRRTVAVDDVSFEVQPGEIFGLIGPNGAGKTTTMECVEGLRGPIAARSRSSDSIPARDAYKLQERIGVQLQEAQLQKRIKVREAVGLLGVAVPTTARRRPAARAARTEREANAWFMTLSGGQKQRLFIALALINDPEWYSSTS